MPAKRGEITPARAGLRAVPAEGRVGLEIAGDELVVDVRSELELAVVWRVVEAVP